MDSRNGVIVIGGHVQGLGIIRIFGKKNIPVVLLDTTKKNIARYSKYCTTFHQYFDLLEQLEKFISQNRYFNWLLIPTHDSHIEVFSKNRETLLKHFKVSVASWDIIKKCFNKVHTYQIAQKCLVPMPKTLFPNDENDLEKINIQFPCIIKPAVMHTFYKHFKTKVFVCKDIEDLVNKYRQALKVIPASEVIIQEIIEGSMEKQYSACFYYKNASSIVQLTARRKRQHPIDFGNATTYAETVEEPKLIEFAKKILNEIKFEGICEVEFKLDKNNEFRFLEINPRTWKWHYISEASGSPFLLSLYNDIYFNEPIISEIWKEATWQHKLTDNVILIKLFLSKMKREPSTKTKNHIYAVFDWSDLKPYIFERIFLFYLLKTR